MTKALIVYASITGNDAEIADIVEEDFEDAGIDVEVSEVSQTDASQLLDADIDVVATYTYDDQIVPEEALDFYEDLQEMDLSGKVYGCCGSGDTFYDDFCASVDRFDVAFAKAGAIKGAENVHVELAPEMDDIEHLDKFVHDLIETQKNL